MIPPSTPQTYIIRSLKGFWSGCAWNAEKRNAQRLPYAEQATKRSRMARDGITAVVEPFNPRPK